MIKRLLVIFVFISLFIIVMFPEQMQIVIDIQTNPITSTTLGKVIMFFALAAISALLTISLARLFNRC